LVAGSAAGDEAGRFPPSVARLLGISPNTPAEEAWDAFLSEHGEVLLRTASQAHRNFGSGRDTHDATMDAYAFILERLRQDDFRRLRAFPGGDAAALTRWLVVVARRLCTDLWRQRYGRDRPGTSELDRVTRRHLADEIWDARPSSELPASKSTNPEWEIRREERRNALVTAVRELEPREQLLLAYRFDDGLSAQRISDLMDLPTPFHVYRKLNKVLAALRTRLRELGVVDPDP
jgi:RNA polymerase sigma factor (sigma-70 family)